MLTIAQIKSLKPEEILALLTAATAQVALSYKISEQGTVACYGVNKRFPVSLYPSQWERLDADKPNRDAFIAANRAELDRIAADKKANPAKYAALKNAAKAKNAAKNAAA